MPPPATGATDQCVVFVRAPGQGVRSIRHLPAAVHDGELSGHIELATGIVSDRFSIASCELYLLDGGGGGGRAPSVAEPAGPQQLTKFVRIDLRAEASSSSLARDDAAAPGGGDDDGCSVAEQGSDDRIPAERFSDLFVACHRGDIEALEAALGRGSALLGHSRHGNTLLHAACSQDQLAAVSLLLAAGADASASNWAGETPLATARRLGAKACERLLRRFEQARTLAPSLSRAPTASAPTAPHADERRRGARDDSQEDERPSAAEVVAIAASLRQRPPDGAVVAARASSSAAERRGPAGPGASPTPPSRAMLGASGASNRDGAASGRPPSRKHRVSSTSSDATDESRPLIRQRRTCNCPRRGKLALLLASGDGADDGGGDHDARLMAFAADERVGRKHLPPSHGLLLAGRRRRRGPRKSVAFVGISDTESSSGGCSYGGSGDGSSSSDDGATSSAADEADSAEARANSRAFRKWLANKRREEQMSDLWRRQSAAAAAAVTGKPAASRQRHGIFILASGDVGDAADDPDPLGYASAYKRWLETNRPARRRRQPNRVQTSASAPAAEGEGAAAAVQTTAEGPRVEEGAGPALHALTAEGGGPHHAVRREAGGESRRDPSPARATSYTRPFSYEEWLSLKAAAAADSEDDAELAAPDGRSAHRRRDGTGLAHAEWLAAVAQRRQSAGERLRKASARELEEAKFKEWARTMNSKRKTFAEWCAEKQLEAAAAAAAQNAAGGDGRSHRTARGGRRRTPRGRSYESWLAGVEQRELEEQAEALANEHAYLRSVLSGTPG